MPSPKSVWDIFRPIYWYLRVFRLWLNEFQVCMELQAPFFLSVSLSSRPSSVSSKTSLWLPSFSLNPNPNVYVLLQLYLLLLCDVEQHKINIFHVHGALLLMVWTYICLFQPITIRTHNHLLRTMGHTWWATNSVTGICVKTYSFYDSATFFYHFTSSIFSFNFNFLSSLLSLFKITKRLVPLIEKNSNIHNHWSPNLKRHIFSIRLECHYLYIRTAILYAIIVYFNVCHIFFIKKKSNLVWFACN